MSSFGDGDFVPKSSTSSAPPKLFWSVLQKHDPKITHEKYGKIAELSWKFKNYALGEWVIPAQKITYEKNGENAEIESTPVTFVVTSLIGALAIDDIPAPRVVALPGKPEHRFTSATPEFPRHWFSRWVKDYQAVSRYFWWATAGFVLATLFAVSYVFGPNALSRFIVRRKSEEVVIGLWAICERA